MRNTPPWAKRRSTAVQLDRRPAGIFRTVCRFGQTFAGIVSEMTIYGDVVFSGSNYGNTSARGYSRWMPHTDGRVLQEKPRSDRCLFHRYQGRDIPLDKRCRQAFPIHGHPGAQESRALRGPPNSAARRMDRKLWKRIGAETPGRELAWEDNHVLTGVCGREKTWRFVLRDGVLEQLEPFQGYEETTPDLSAYDGLSLPAVPGRQYKATATAAVKMGDGSTLIGTSDAMLALYKDGKVFSLGAAAP